MKSGLPQELVLEPLTFIILISDIDEHLNFSIGTYFANVTSVVKVVENQGDCQKLHNDLDKIFHCAEESSMEFSRNKLELMMYTARGTKL